MAIKTFSLTQGQKMAVDGISKIIDCPFKPTQFIAGLSGPSGSGKSTSINFIVNHCKYSKSVICFTAPTHKACRVLDKGVGKGLTSTIHSIFGFRLGLNLEDFNPANPQFQPVAPAKLDNIRVLIVDEASMLNASLVTYICTKCKDNEIKLIFVGDSFQLAPVGSSKSVAFERCHKLFELTEIVRQDDMNPVLFLADMLRRDIERNTVDFMKYVTSNVGKMDYNSIGEGYSILNMGDFKMSICNKFNMDSYKEDIDNNRIICYTNRRVNGWNNFVRTNIINSKGKLLVKDDLMMSYISLFNDFNAPILENSEEYIIHDLKEYVTEDHMKGYVVKFQLVHGGTITPAFTVIDHTDQATLQIFLKTLYSYYDEAIKANKIKRVAAWKKYYKFKNKHLLLTDIKFGNFTLMRDIDYGFAITAHKSQGSTYNTVFVDFTDMVFSKTGMMFANLDDMKRRLYVACTREKQELLICYSK